MPQKKFERYIVAFEAIDNEVPDKVYHRGEIDFRCFGSDLVWNIQNVLRLIGQPFVAYQQTGVVARPTKLWGIGKNGRRVRMDLPQQTISDYQKQDEERRRRWSSIPVGYGPLL